VTDIANLAAAISDDLRRVDDELRWAYTDGHWPQGANPDRVAGAHTQDVIGRDGHNGEAESPNEQPEWIRYDIGVASAASRNAWRQTIGLLRTCEMRVALALSALGQRNEQPALVRPTSAMHTSLHHQAIVNTVAALEFVVDDWPDADRPAQRAARRHLTGRGKPASARAAADAAVRLLVNALARGDADGKATAEPYCRICRIREQYPRAGGRCKTCATWKTRNGFERPTTIDAEELDQPRQAAARRHARGEGWGAA
jgi:hypothetical protein